MSRHAILAKDPAHNVAIGWDNPMTTFFAHVIDRRMVNDTTLGQDPVVLWLGSTDREFLRVEDLVTALARYADVSDDMVATLRADRAATLDTGPTPLQRTRFT